MQAVLNWYLKNRIVFNRQVGGISIDDIQQSNDQIIQMLDSGASPVHVVIDYSYVTSIPTNLLQLSYATSFVKHPAKGWLITISTTPMPSFLARIIPQIAGCQRYRVFTELEHGLDFLRQQDSSLNWSDANQELTA